VITDYFVIASGTSDRQVRTIADEVERVLAERGSKAVRREGRSDGRWVLLDFVDLVVHIFVTEERQYYELERLWSDAPRVRWEQRARTGTRRAPSRPDKAG
jgi:ribosome-associated protein